MNEKPKSRTPRQLERQARAFFRNVVDGIPYREIAKELGVSVGTIVADMRAEEHRRAEELADRREVETARALAIYRHAIAEGFRLARKADDVVTIGEGVTSAPFVGLARGIDSAVRARERVDKLLGLDAAARLDPAVESLLKALDTDVPPPEHIPFEE